MQLPMIASPTTGAGFSGTPQAWAVLQCSCLLCFWKPVGKSLHFKVFTDSSFSLLKVEWLGTDKRSDVPSESLSHPLPKEVCTLRARNLRILFTTLLYWVLGPGLSLSSQILSSSSHWLNSAGKVWLKSLSMHSKFILSCYVPNIVPYRLIVQLYIMASLV